MSDNFGHRFVFLFEKSPGDGGRCLVPEIEVRVEGLEPPRLAAPDPKSGTSTNFAIPAVWKEDMCPGFAAENKTERIFVSFFLFKEA